MFLGFYYSTSAYLIERTSGHFRVVARQLVEQITVVRRILLEVERDAVLLSDALEGAVEPRPCSEGD